MCRFTVNHDFERTHYQVTISGERRRYNGYEFWRKDQILLGQIDAFQNTCEVSASTFHLMALHLFTLPDHSIHPRGWMMWQHHALHCINQSTLKCCFGLIVCNFMYVKRMNKRTSRCMMHWIPRKLNQTTQETLRQNKGGKETPGWTL